MKDIHICLLVLLVLTVSLYSVNIINVITHIRTSLKKPKRDPILIHLKQEINDVSCHHVTKEDALKAVEDLHIEPNSRSIFFHDTTCRGGLNSRQACAVEAAARAHPNWQIYVLFSSSVTSQGLNNDCMTEVLKFPNVKFARIDIFKYCRGTVFTGEFLANLEGYQYAVERTADILKFVTLSKWGGVYLDFQLLVVKSLEGLGSNWVVREGPQNISTKILALNTIGDVENFAETILFKISEHYHSRDRNYSVTEVVYSTLYKRCPYLLNSTSETVKCQGLTIYPVDWFYPYNFTYWYVYYSARHLEFSEPVYTHAIWQVPEFEDESTISNDSTYSRLARMYCPNIYGLYGEWFGL